MGKEKSKKFDGVYYNLLANGDKSYYISYKDENNKKVWLKVGLHSQGIRENYCNQKRVEILNKIRLGEDIPIKHKKRNIFTFEMAFNEYIKWAEVNKKTWKDDFTRYNNHLKEFFATKELITLKSKDFEDFKQKKLESGLKPQTVIHFLAIARHTINYAIKNELVKNYQNPISDGKVKMPKLDNESLAFFTYEEAHKLLNALKNRHYKSYQLSTLMLFTGARFEEIVSLKWSDINFNTNTIYFKSTKQGNSRHIYIVDEVKKVLDELKNENINNSDLIIPNNIGAKYDKMPTDWRKICDEVFPNNVNVDENHRFKPHSLRHTHASWLAQNGVDILQIKEQLGHKTLTMTLRYAHLIPHHRHEATKELFNKFNDTH